MARAWCPFLKLVFLFRVSQDEKGLLLLGAVSPKLPTVFPATDESFIRVRGSVKATPLLLGTSPCPDLVAILAFICCEESSSSCQVQAHGFTVSMRIISLDNTVLGTLVGVCRREESVANMSTGLRIGRDKRVIQASASAVRSLLIR